MLTKEIGETHAGQPEAARSAMLALSVLIDRIGSLPKADRDDLFELFQAWRSASDLEEQVSIRQAVEEILAQTPITVMPMPLTGDEPLLPGLKRWVEHVGQRIRELRLKAALNQTQLAEKAGLTQSTSADWRTPSIARAI